MAITTAMCTTFKKELLEAVHNFKNTGGSTFNLALYTSSASLGASTTAYTTSNEISGTGYTAKGASLTRVDPSNDGTTAITDFSDLTFSSSSITARGALIFNDSASGDPSVFGALRFRRRQTSSLVTSQFSFPQLMHLTRLFALLRMLWPAGSAETHDQKAVSAMAKTAERSSP